MKNLLFFLLIALAACQKQVEVPVTSNPILIVDYDKPPMAEMKAEQARVTMERGKPVRPPKPPKHFPPTPPTDTTTTPPTVPQGETIALLDWKGHESRDNAWSLHYGTNGVLYSPPANITEAQVDYMIAKSAAQYAGWKITFTKDEALFNAHTGKKTRIVLTSTDVLFPGATGVAFVGSNEGPLSEVFVFTENMLNLDRYMFRIVVHEMGHAANLYHQSLYNDDCSLNSRYRYPYNMGYDWDSENGGIWGYGTSLSCNTYQDDNAVLTASLGTR